MQCFCVFVCRVVTPKQVKFLNAVISIQGQSFGRQTSNHQTELLLEQWQQILAVGCTVIAYISIIKIGQFDFLSVSRARSTIHRPQSRQNVRPQSCKEWYTEHLAKREILSHNRTVMMAKVMYKTMWLILFKPQHNCLNTTVARVFALLLEPCYWSVESRSIGVEDVVFLNPDPVCRLI